VHNVVTIARRELSSYFSSLMAYIFLVVFLLVAGWMFFGPFFLMGRADMRGFFAPSPFSPALLLVILAPALTMRLIAEERKSKTIELLTTTPVTDAEVVGGKFLGAFGLVLIALASTLVYVVTVKLLGPLDLGTVFAGYLGLALFAASLLAIGLLMSTLTENQIVAFVIGLLVCGALYYVYWLQFLVPQALAPLLEYVSVSFHLDNLARGVVDTRDVLYYLTVTCGGLFLATLSLSRQHA
jgi:ABC-2 type transport system permease protein